MSFFSQIKKVVARKETARSQDQADNGQRDSRLQADLQLISAVRNVHQANGTRSILIRDLPEACFLDDRASSINGRVTYQTADEDRLSLLRIGFHGHVDPAGMEGVEVELQSICDLQIRFASSNSKVKVGKGAQGNWIIGLFRAASVEIGDNVTCNGSIAMVDDGDLIVGDDCMFANTFIHAGDNHAIFDIQSGEPLNVRRARIEFESHVWAAARAAIIGDAVIGAGSVIAADATVKGNVPPCSLVAGVPARVVRSGISWTRDPTGRGWEEVVRGLAGT